MEQHTNTPQHNPTETINFTYDSSDNGPIPVHHSDSLADQPENDFDTDETLDNLDAVTVKARD